MSRSKKMQLAQSRSKSVSLLLGSSSILVLAGHSMAAPLPVSDAGFIGSVTPGTPENITGNATLSSLTTSEGTFTSLAGATANNVITTNLLSSVGTAPANANAAVTGLSANDGVNNLQSGNFVMGGGFNATTRFFILESTPQSSTVGDPTEVRLIDSSNNVVGSYLLSLTAANFTNSAPNTTNTSLATVTYTAGQGNLVQKLGATTFSLADLGVTGDVSNVVGIRLTSPGAVGGTALLDPNVVGTFAVNNSQLLITSSPASSNTMTGASAKTIDLGRVVQVVGGTVATASQTIGSVGTDTTFTRTLAGDVVSSTFAASGTITGGTSLSGTISLSRSTSGSKSGTVTFDNTSTDLTSPGLGSNDANDIFTVTANVYSPVSISAGYNNPTQTGGATYSQVGVTNPVVVVGQNGNFIAGTTSIVGGSVSQGYINVIEQTALGAPVVESSVLVLLDLVGVDAVYGSNVALANSVVTLLTNAGYVASDSATSFGGVLSSYHSLNSYDVAISLSNPAGVDGKFTFAFDLTSVAGASVANIAVVPEPTGIASMLALGGVGFLSSRRRRNR